MGRPQVAGLGMPLVAGIVQLFLVVGSFAANNTLQGRAQLACQVGTAANKKSRHVSVAVDDNRLRDGCRGIAAGNHAIDVQGHGWIKFQTFESRLDPGGRFLQIHGDKLDVPLLEFMDNRVDLGHRLDAGTTPGCPEVEDHDLALMLGELKRLSVEQLQRKVGRGVADHGGFGPLGPGRFAIGGDEFWIDCVVQSPASKGELRRRVIDLLADQEDIDVREFDMAAAQQLTCARQLFAIAFPRMERQPRSIAA